MAEGVGRETIGLAGAQRMGVWLELGIASRRFASSCEVCWIGWWWLGVRQRPKAVGRSHGTVCKRRLL